MIRLIALLTRKPGMSPEEFREYYETHHVPLIEEINPYRSGYTRNYVLPGMGSTGSFSEGPKGWDPDFDVVTLVTFASQEDFDKARASFAKPENSSRIAADEEKFIDRSKKQLILTDPTGVFAPYAGGHG